MQRIVAVLIAAAGVGGWFTPSAAQKASRGPSLRAAPYVYLTPTPFLGSLTARVPRTERPSVGRVNSYTALAGLSVLGVAAVAPRRLRPWVLGAAIAVQAFTIHGSVRQGLPIRFP